MKVYLDDLRPCPEGYVLARTIDEAIKLLMTGTVTEISLDHDLGFDHYAGIYKTDHLGFDGTGMDVVKWMEVEIFVHNAGDMVPRVIKVHSSNPAGRERMLAGIRHINEERTKRGI